MPEEQEEVGTEQEAQPVIPQQEVTPSQTIALTQEQLDELKNEIGKEAFAKYQGIQRTVSAREREIKQLQKQIKELQTSPNVQLMESMLKILKTKQSDDETPNPEIPKLEEQIKGIKVQDERSRLLESQAKITQDWRDKIEAKIREAGIEPEDERLEDVWDSFTDAENYFGVPGFERTERKLSKVLKTMKQPEPPEKKEDVAKTPVIKDEDLLAELRRRKLMLQDVNPSPIIPKTLTAEDLKKMSPEERWARWKEIEKLPLGFK